MSAADTNELTNVEMAEFAADELMKNPGFGPRQPPKPNKIAPEAARCIHFLQRGNLITHSFENCRLLLRAFIDLALDLNSNRLETAFYDGLPKGRRGRGLSRSERDPATTRVQIDLHGRYAINAFDRTLYVVRSRRSRQAADVDDRVGGFIHGIGRCARRLLGRRTSRRKGGGH